MLITIEVDADFSYQDKTHRVEFCFSECVGAVISFRKDGTKATTEYFAVKIKNDKLYIWNTSDDQWKLMSDEVNTAYAEFIAEREILG